MEKKTRVDHVKASTFFTLAANNLLVTAPTPGGGVQITFVNDAVDLRFSELSADGNDGVASVRSPNESVVPVRELAGRVLLDLRTARVLIRLLTEAVERASPMENLVKAATQRAESG